MKECRHKFKPRYNKTWSTVLEGLAEVSGVKVKSAFKGFDPYLKSEAYIHDICVKCGLVKGKEQ